MADAVTPAVAKVAANCPLELGVPALMVTKLLGVHTPLSPQSALVAQVAPIVPAVQSPSVAQATGLPLASFSSMAILPTLTGVPVLPSLQPCPNEPWVTVPPILTFVPAVTGLGLEVSIVSVQIFFGHRIGWNSERNQCAESDRRDGCGASRTEPEDRAFDVHYPLHSRH